jgi:DNA-binding MarR family transcriptional regulator
MWIMLHVTTSIDRDAAPAAGESTAVAAGDLVEEIIGELEPLIIRQYQAAAWHDRTISKTNMFVLMLLMEHGQMPMNRLAAMLDVSFSSLSGIIDRMEERGLVERMRDENDRRLVLVRSTATGHASVADLQEMRRDYLRRVLRAMTQGDRQTCHAAFAAMRRAADAILPDAATGSPTPPKSSGHRANH